MELVCCYLEALKYDFFYFLLYFYFSFFFVFFFFFILNSKTTTYRSPLSIMDEFVPGALKTFDAFRMSFSLYFVRLFCTSLLLTHVHTSQGLILVLNSVNARWLRHHLTRCWPHFFHLDPICRIPRRNRRPPIRGG